MSFDSLARILVYELILSGLTLWPASAQQTISSVTDETAAPSKRGCQCLLVANYDMCTGKPCLNIVTASQAPHPVVCDVDVRDDTTVYITLHLPYSWPDRGHRMPDSCFPARSFHLHLLTEVDSAHYFIQFDPDAGRVRPVAIRSAEFLGVIEPKTYPPGVVMIQLTGSDHQLATQLLNELESSGEEGVLEPGYYCGVPRRIRVARLGAKRFNETVDGRLLAVELRDPLNDETFATLKNLVETHNLTWFHPPLEADR